MVIDVVLPAVLGSALQLSDVSDGRRLFEY